MTASTSSVSFIGLGGMTRAIAARAIAGGNTVELIGRDTAKAESLAAALGGGATVGTFGAAPTGDLVVLAVPYASAVAVVEAYGDALAGKIVIDISNAFDSSATELLTPPGTSGAEQIAKALPPSAHVVKAFNTIFGHVLAKRPSLDAFFAGDDASAKARVSTFIASLGLRPLDVGGLRMARYLEGVGPLLMGLARNGVESFDFALAVSSNKDG